jgi:hypothetical protein
MRLGARARRKRSIRIGAPAAQDEFGFRSGDGDGEPKKSPAARSTAGPIPFFLMLRI